MTELFQSDFFESTKIDKREELLRVIRERKIGNVHMSMMEHYIEFENNTHEYLYNAAEGRIGRII